MIHLIGEQNPYGSDPEFALYPRPEGASGHRLCAVILGMYEAAYLRSFWRRNLCDGDWSGPRARENAQDFLLRVDLVDSLILCGSKVAGAFGIAFRPFLKAFVRAPSARGHIRALVLPHPSGRNKMWNDPKNITRARESVIRFAPELVDQIGRIERREAT